MADAKTRYKRKARKAGRVHQVNVEFYQKDAALYEHLQRNKPAATYLKSLLRADMERNGHD